MVTRFKFFESSTEKKTIIFHALLGVAIFYFIFHPVTMVLYWFEFKNEPITIASFFEVLAHRTKNSFSHQMVKMSMFFIVMGGLFGIITGLYRVKNKKLNQHLSLVKNDLLKLIVKGENQYFELKSSIRYDYQLKKINIELELVIAKTLVGFMNAKGGKIIIGVNDDGKILGLENDFNSLKLKNTDGFEQKIYQIISNLIGKEYSPFVTVFFQDIEKNKICIIDIEKAAEPAYVISGKNTTFYLRTGNSTRALSIKEAMHYMNMEKEV